MPVLYEPSIIVVCQGRKLGYLGDRSFVYDAQQYLVLSVPLPFECETFASPDEPFLAISIRVDLAVIAELAILLDETLGAAVSEPHGVYSTPLDAPLADAVVRLLEALASPHDTCVLGPAIMREIAYRVLTGAQGDAIRAALAQQHHFGRVAKALRRIHADLKADLDVETLAREAGMSLAVFHAQFKHVTATSPMQYVKAARLHQARLMMVQDWTASVRVPPPRGSAMRARRSSAVSSSGCSAAAPVTKCAGCARAAAGRSNRTSARSAASRAGDARRKAAACGDAQRRATLRRCALMPA